MIATALPKGTRVKADHAKSLPLNLQRVNGEIGTLEEDYDPAPVEEWDPVTGLELHAPAQVAVRFKRGRIVCRPAHLIVVG